MTSLRHALLACLPKVLISRSTGLLTRTPLPASLRAPFYSWFASRYGASLDEVEGDLGDYRSLSQFFARPLVAGARPIADTALVSPNDGRVVSAGPIEDDRIPQVKGIDYSLADLVGDAELAAALRSGSQATIYLAPGDYHRVHSPFDARVESIHSIGGTLYPVNGPAVRAVPGLFARNARTVFRCSLDDGRAAAVVMVGALNVGDVYRSVEPGQVIRRGDEVGRFGFGSTTVCLLAPGEFGFPQLEPERELRMGEALPS